MVDVARPTPAEQRATWLTALGPQAGPTADRLTGQFDFDVATIRRHRPHGGGCRAGRTAAAALGRLRGHRRPRMDALAQRIETAFGWDDIVLPEPS